MSVGFRYESILSIGYELSILRTICCFSFGESITVTNVALEMHNLRCLLVGEANRYDCCWVRR